MTAALRLRYFVPVNQSQSSFPPYSSAGPSAWNPPNSLGGGSSSDSSSSYFARSFNSNVVVVMAVLLFALVVAAFINTMARCILHRGRGPQQQIDGSAGMRDKGLDKREIEALPVVAYGSSVSTHNLHLDGSECVVCLSEFIPGEQVRLLPGCHHGFHIACIDAWLLTHASCPVCRHSAIPGDPSCSSNSNENEPSPLDCVNNNNNSTSARVSGSARFGSSRFGSARIASHNLEIEVGAPGSATSGVEAATAAAAVSSTNASGGSRPRMSILSSLSGEAVGRFTRRFWSRN